MVYKWFKWRISDLRSVSARVNARGYPCAKGCNSSASQWLSGEQVRLCLGHPKVHFGTIVEGSWGGGGARWVLRALSLEVLRMLNCDCSKKLQHGQLYFDFSHTLCLSSDGTVKLNCLFSRELRFETWLIYLWIFALNCYWYQPFIFQKNEQNVSKGFVCLLCMAVYFSIMAISN